MTQGQINENTERYKILKNIIQKYKPKKILEIGTWKGLGSTKCIIDSIGNDVEFISLETNKNFYDIAVNNLKEFSGKVKLIFGRIVEISEIENFVNGVKLSDEEKKWLEGDLKNMKNCENVLNILPEKFDLILLDGGEFSTYSEWTKLKDRCDIVVLDDINVLKSKKVYEELISNKNYVILEQTQEGHGFCVFKKK